MNGRTCQLCGKALSRFTVGSGGDFCSREHRNQFRLRLGMDRLMEANKVASLMRRRENAKSIPATQLVRDSVVLPRVAPVLRMPVRPPAPHTPKPIAAALESPGIVSRSGVFRPSAPAAATMHSDIRPIEPHAFVSQFKRPALVTRAERFQPRILPAGMVIPRLNGAQVAKLRREVSELRLNLRRTHFGGSGIQLQSLRLPTQNCQESQPARRLTNSADRGCELRVSGGIGFRLPRPRIRAIPLRVARTTLPTRNTGPRGLPQKARTKDGSTLSAGVIRFVVRGPAAPLSPQHSNGVGFQYPNVLLSGVEPPREFITDARHCDVKWLAPSPCPPQPRYTNGVARLRPPVSPGPALNAPAPRGIAANHRLTEVDFQPQEAFFECPTALHGTLLSNMPFGAAAPVRKVEAPLPTLEEHFDSGLHDWVGGIENWKVDVAGVRPGALAYYSPSLDLTNYLLEFLTRVEARGITWVFRGSDQVDYYKATLAPAKGGGFEFRRSAVIGGMEEGSTVVTVPPASPTPTGKTAVTVRTRVAGDEFTVSIDSQVIETWTDARLTAGGIGFVGAPEERARLYWVKVTPLGHLNKEYSKR